MSVKRDPKTKKWIASYRVRMPDGSLKRTTKRGLPSKDAALSWELEHKHEAVGSSDVLFSQMFEEMERHSNANENTAQQRRNRLQRYAPKLWSMPIRKITKAQLQSWRADLRETDLSTSTVNSTIRYLKSVFRYADVTYDIPDVSRILRGYPKDKDDDAEEMRIITFPQFRELISHEKNDLCRKLMIFLYYTGCRKGEARALLKSDFDPIRKTVRITKSMRRYEDSVKDPKNRQSIRTVPLDDSTAEMVAELCQRPGPWLFGDYRPCSLTTLQDHFKADLKAAGLDPRLRLHDLRHSHVSLLWYNGVSVPEISRRIGHSSPKVTMDRYSHIFDNNQTDSLAVLNSLGDSSLTPHLKKARKR